MLQLTGAIRGRRNGNWCRSGRQILWRNADQQISRSSKC